MSTTLSVIAESLCTPSLPHAGYTRDLTRALIATAPEGCDVAAIVGSHTGDEIAALHERVPGLCAAHVVPVAADRLPHAWRLGLAARDLGALVHAPGLIAPLKAHDRSADGTQTVVTVHDLAAWSAYDPGDAARARLLRSFARRAHKHADAVVVPTHALALRLADHVDFGDRIRVISPAPSTTLIPGEDADERARALRLPKHFIAAADSPDDRGVRDLLTGLANRPLADMAVVLLGSVDDELARTIAALPSTVRVLGNLGEADRAVVLSRAYAFVDPARAVTSGAALIEAMSFSLPLVHAETPVAAEIAGGFGLEVPVEPADDYPHILADALASLSDDEGEAERRAVMSRDRVQAFSWLHTAQRVWQLHADL